MGRPVLSRVAEFSHAKLDSAPAYMKSSATPARSEHLNPLHYQ